MRFWEIVKLEEVIFKVELVEFRSLEMVKVVLLLKVKVELVRLRLSEAVKVGAEEVIVALVRLMFLKL